MPDGVSKTTKKASKYSAICASVLSLMIVTSCASSKLQYEKEDELKKNKEFEQAVVIVAPPAEPEQKEEAAKPETAKTPDKEKSTAKTPEIPKKVIKTPLKKLTKKQAAIANKRATPGVRQPDIENGDGFEPGSRRPINDPFRAGEEVVHDVHYFKVSAGELKIKVEPFAMVNNRKSYSFAIEIKTSSLFNAFYSVEDRVETFVDFETLVPSVFQLHVKESDQLREAKMLFDNEKGVARFWENKVTKADGVEEKKEEWEILPYTQNVYSAIFYMRNFKWETGKEYAFRVSNDKENLVFSGKAIRREVLDTKLGPMKAIVIQPNIVLKGKFKPIGENLIWLSDDDRKYILRIEAKIKIGTLISEVVKINPGKP